MYEKDVKRLVFRTLLNVEEKDSVFINEFTTGWRARADVAVFNSHVHLIEVKSSHDSLQRLENQINCFLAYGEKCTVVVSPKRYQRIVKRIPQTVGVWIVENGEIIIDREAKKRNVEANLLAEWWWVCELKVLLGNVLPGASRLHAEALRKALVELLPYETLCLWTKENLKVKFRERSLKLIDCVLNEKPFPKWEMPQINKDYLLKLRNELIRKGIREKASSMVWDCRSRCWRRS